MSTLTANIVTSIHKTGITPLSTVMQFLVAMVTTDASDGCATVCTNGGSQTLVSLCYKMMPEDFIRLLLEQIAREVVLLISVTGLLTFCSQIL